MIQNNHWTITFDHLATSMETISHLWNYLRSPEKTLVLHLWSSSWPTHRLVCWVAVARVCVSPSEDVCKCTSVARWGAPFCSVRAPPVSAPSQGDNFSCWISLGPFLSLILNPASNFTLLLQPFPILQSCFVNSKMAIMPFYSIVFPSVGSQSSPKG